MFSIVYSVPRGGKREFSFSSSEELYNHVSANAPGLFAGVPKLEDKDYYEKLENMQRRSYRLPELKS